VCAGVAGARPEDEMDLLGLVEPQPNPGPEKIPGRNGFLARILHRRHHGHPTARPWDAMAPAHQYQPPSGGHDQAGGQHDFRTGEPKSPPPGEP
jgi:hypothetical protein